MRKLPRVLVVEDEPSIAELIAVNLRHNGFAPTVVYDGSAAQREVDAVLPDLILLDWMLPGESGASLARQWRKNDRTKSVPIIMLTARSDESDKIQGLDAGADDYIMKPFKSYELLARLRALMRRVDGHDVTELIGNGIVLDTEARTCTCNDVEVSLTSTEYQLLELLMRNSGRVISRQQILRDVWNTDWSGSTKNLDMHVSALRRKLGEEGEHVSTIRGLGFRFDRT